MGLLFSRGVQTVPSLWEPDFVLMCGFVFANKKPAFLSIGNHV